MALAVGNWQLANTQMTEHGRRFIFTAECGRVFSPMLAHIPLRTHQMRRKDHGSISISSIITPALRCAPPSATVVERGPGREKDASLWFLAMWMWSISYPIPDGGASVGRLSDSSRPACVVCHPRSPQSHHEKGTGTACPHESRGSLASGESNGTRRHDGVVETAPSLHGRRPSRPWGIRWQRRTGKKSSVIRSDIRPSVRRKRSKKGVLCVCLCLDST